MATNGYGMPNYPRARGAQNDPYGLNTPAAPSAPSVPAGGPPTGGDAPMPDWLRQMAGGGRPAGANGGGSNGGAVASAYGGGGGQQARVAPVTPLVNADSAHASGSGPIVQPQSFNPAGGSPGDVAHHDINRNYRHEGYAYHYVRDVMDSLYRDSLSGYSPDMQASLIAPGLQSLDASYKNANAGLQQQLDARGLGDSSAMAAGLGALSSARANAGSSLVSQLMQRDQERRDAARGQLGSLSMAEQNGSRSGVLNAIQAYQQYLMNQKKMDAMGGFNIGAIISALGGAAGAAAGVPGLGAGIGGLFGGGGGGGFPTTDGTNTY